MLTALMSLALLAPPAVGTFVDPKSKEELLLIEHDGTAQVFYAAKTGKHRQELKVSGDVAGGMVQVTFPDPSKKYVLEWTTARDHLECSNPDGTQQRFDRVDLEQPPFKSPEAVVRALYQHFPEEAQIIGARNLVRVPKEERSPFLTAALEADLETVMAHCDGPPCGPYMDWLYAAQDIYISNVTVGPADAKHVVTVSFENHGKKEKLKVRTEKGADGWRVADIQYEKDYTLAKSLAEAAKGVKGVK